VALQGEALAPSSQMMAAVAQSLLADSAFFSFGSVRHVEAVERGPIASLEQQAFAVGAGAPGQISLSREGWKNSANDIWNATISDGGGN
jgi:hypothetical protein